MRERSKSSPAVLDIRFSGGVPFRTTREHQDALSLIRRLVAAPGVGIADLGPSAAILEPLTGGRSGAHVFKLTPLFGADGPVSHSPVSHSQVKGSPLVVKIAPRAEGASEKAKYDRFVRSGLPAACRAELLGFARTRDRSGLCYSFVGGRDGSRLETLTDTLQRGDTTALDLVLRKIFDPLRDTWYSPDLIRRHSDIARRYLDRYFTGKRGAAKTEATLRACAARYFNAEQKDRGCRIGGAWFPSAYAVLFASDHKRPYHSCILHGDLNTDNIVVVPNRAPDQARVTLIDFQKTGRGHVYQDLVSLEASVRINYPPDASTSDILETERLIALGRRQPRADPYAAAIRKIRAAAFRSFGRLEDDANYHFAVAAIGLRLMQAVDLSDVARARITISTLWAAKALTGDRST